MNEAAVLGGPRASAGEHDADAVSAGIAGSEAASALADFLARHPWLGAVIASFAAREPEAPWTRRRLLQALDHAVAEIDLQLGRQLDAVLHHPRFQRLEAAWRSLRRLVWLADAYDTVKIRVIHLTWSELCRDLERAIEFDQSQIFHKIYNEEFGTPGGQPYGLLIGDYEVMHRRTAEHPTDDVAALKAMSQVAAAAFAPFVVGAAPGLFGLDSFRDLALPIDLAGAFRSPDYARWRSLQEGEDARFLGIVLPRVLARLPYRDDGTRFDDFRYEEASEEAAHHLWGSAIYAFAAVVTRSCAGSGWFIDMRGARRADILVDGAVRPHGGLVTHLPVAWYETDRPGLIGKGSSEVALTERQEKELSDLGFIPLLPAKNTNFLVFYGNQSVQSPRLYDGAGAAANARISAMLQYMFCVSRFAHYLKVMARDRVGSFATPEQCQDYLSDWLRDYCNANQNPSPEIMARYPLREAQVRVHEPPGRPGVYQCVVHLRPHSQVDHIVSEFKLVTELAPRAA